MSFIGDVLSSAKDDDIGGFDQNESSDLGLHVRQCGRRFRTLDSKLTFVIRILLSLGALELLSKLPGGWGWILKVFS